MHSLHILDENRYPARKKIADFGTENCMQSHLLSFPMQPSPQGGHGCGHGGNCGEEQGKLFQDGNEVQGKQQGEEHGGKHGFCPQKQFGRKDTHLPIL